MYSSLSEIPKELSEDSVPSNRRALIPASVQFKAMLRRLKDSKCRSVCIAVMLKPVNVVGTWGSSCCLVVIASATSNEDCRGGSFQPFAFAAERPLASSSELALHSKGPLGHDNHANVWSHQQDGVPMYRSQNI